MIDVQVLKGNPFFLDDEGCEWVNKTLAGMSEDEKIGQIFCIAGCSPADPLLKHAVAEVGVGGMMLRPQAAEAVRAAVGYAADLARIPLFFAANLESGGTGLIKDGTDYATQAMLAAGGDPAAGYKLGCVCGEEASLIGANWSFAPVVDLDLNPHNAVMQNRSYGSNPDTVIEMAGAYIKAAQEHDLAVAVKHFPGDGTDEWDHHYEPSSNQLSFAEWDQSYGRVYRALFAKGAQTVMAGHIALPAYMAAVAPAADQYAPATLNPYLLQNLLRGHLGFNGMVVTDSTNMLAFLTYMPRCRAVPYAIASGCDMFLFNKSLDEDFAFLKQGLHDGLVTGERLDEAVTRILAVKASLKLPQKQRQGTLIPESAALRKLGNPLFAQWAGQAAQNAVTLVKDTQAMLPLTPEKYPRIYLNVLLPTDEPDAPLRQAFKAAFEQEGFAVDLRDRTQRNDYETAIEENNKGVALLKDHYDAAVYIAHIPQDDQLAVHLSWRGFHARGNDAPWFIKEIPTLFVSISSPYFLRDVPMVQTYINTYGKTAYTVEALMNCITGRVPFIGTPPADPFCRRPEAKA